jgi:hypothetical protein
MKGVLIGALAITVLAFPETILAQSAASNPPAVSSGHTGSQTRAHHRRHAAHSAKSKSTKGSTSANQLNRREAGRHRGTRFSKPRNAAAPEGGILLWRVRRLAPASGLMTRLIRGRLTLLHLVPNPRPRRCRRRTRHCRRWRQ